MRPKNGRGIPAAFFPLHARRGRLSVPQASRLPCALAFHTTVTARKTGRDIHLVFILGALAGLRRGEIHRAQWSDVKWDEGLIAVRGEKTKSSAADVPLHQDFRAALEPYRGADDDYIVAPDNLTVGTWDYRWDHGDAMREVQTTLAGVPHCTTHMLRHSVAQRLANTDHSEMELARFLRHTTGSVATRAYYKTRLVPINIVGSL